MAKFKNAKYPIVAYDYFFMTVTSTSVNSFKGSLYDFQLLKFRCRIKGFYEMNMAHHYQQDNQPVDCPYPAFLHRPIDKNPVHFSPMYPGFQPLPDTGPCNAFPWRRARPRECIPVSCVSSFSFLILPPFLFEIHVYIGKYFVLGAGFLFEINGFNTSWTTLPLKRLS